MVALANFFVAIFGSITGFLGLQMAKKTLFAATAIAAGLALTGAFFLTIKGLLVGIAYAVPTWAAGWAAAIIPNNLAACVSAIIAAHMARFIYTYNMDNIKLASYIT